MGARQPADPERLQRRLDELENRVRSLRMSRRVLLDLLRRVHDDGRRRIDRLEAEVARLRVRNRSYALRIWRQNRLLASLGVWDESRRGGRAGNGPVGSKQYP